jgi:hypothetical protein
MILVMKTNYNTGTMVNICVRCGKYAVEKEIRPTGVHQAVAICSHCGNEQPFAYLPLFIVTGASGAGKSSLCLRAAARDRHHLHLETDMLWGALPAAPDDDYVSYHNHWLRVAKNAGQGGRPVVLYGSGNPGQIQACPERRYFSRVHYLALVCTPDELSARLRARPAWRAAGSAQFMEGMLAYNAWFQDQAAQPGSRLDLLDTTGQPLERTLEEVLAWLSARWNPSGLAVKQPANLEET